VEEDIYESCRKHASDKVTRRFEMLWQDEMQKPQPSLIRVATKVFWLRVIIVGAIYGVFEAACK
jgi:ATP-binding cassette subfamily C (CFTR/MRP) protein 4